MKRMIVACALAGCAAPPAASSQPPPPSPTHLTSLTATPIDGVGSFSHHLAWTIEPGDDGADCAIDLEGTGTFEAVPCQDGAVDHAYARGIYDVVLRSGDDEIHAHVRAPADPPIASVEPVVDLRGLVGDVTSLAWNPAGTRVATASGGDDRVQLWTATGAPAASLVGLTASPDVAAFPLAWSGDGARLAVAGRTGTTDVVDVWDAATATRINRIMLPGTAWAVALGHDGSRLAVGIGNIAETYDVTSATRIGVFTGQSGLIRAIALSPDDALLATGSTDELRTWDATGDGTSAERLMIPNTFPIASLAFDAAGERIAFAGSSSIAAITDLAGHIITLSNAAASSSPDGRVAWSPDSSSVAIATTHGTTIALFDASTGQPTGSVATPDGTLSLAWRSDGALTYGNASQQVRIAGSTDVLVDRLPPTAAAVSPDGTRLAYADWSAIRIRDLATGLGTATLPLRGRATHILWVHDVIGVVYDGGVDLFAPDGTARASISTTVSDAAISPGADRIAIGDDDGHLRVYNIAGNLLRSLALSEGELSDPVRVAWRPAGGALVAEVKDAIAVLSASTLSPQDVITTAQSSAAPLAWSIDDVLAYNNFVEVDLRDLPTGTESQLHFDPSQLAWSPFGAKLAIATDHPGTLRLHDVDTGTDTTVPVPHTFVHGVSWSDDARLIATSGAEGRVIVWRLTYE